MASSVRGAVWVALVGSALSVGGVGELKAQGAPCTVAVALGATSYGTLLNFKDGKAPYSATVVTTRDQKMADGSMSHSTATTHQARDSTGRERGERSLGCQPGPDGERHPVVRVFISDPASLTTISWTVDDPAKVLHVFHDRARPAIPPVKTDERSEAAALRAMAHVGIQVQDLGSKTVGGVMADGKRTVNTPAGQAGDVQPLKIVTETWIAKDLGLAMLNIDDNSRLGKTTTEVIDLKLGEPDASLFEPPAGFKVEEQKVGATGSASVQ